MGRSIKSAEATAAVETKVVERERNNFPEAFDIFGFKVCILYVNSSKTSASQLKWKAKKQ